MPRPNPVPTLRNRLRIATTTAILTAAEETLALRGLPGAGIAEIATRAGVSVGTLYNHFEDRESLISALMEARGKELLLRIDEADASLCKESFRARLLGFAAAFLEHCALHQRLFNAMMAESARCAPPPRAEEQKRDMMQQVRERVGRLMASGVKEGEIAGDGVTLSGFLFLGLLRGAMMHMNELADRPPKSAKLAPNGDARVPRRGVQAHCAPCVGEPTAQKKGLEHGSIGGHARRSPPPRWRCFRSRL